MERGIIEGVRSPRGRPRPLSLALRGDGGPLKRPCDFSLKVCLSFVGRIASCMAWTQRGHNVADAVVGHAEEAGFDPAAADSGKHAESGIEGGERLSP